MINSIDKWKILWYNIIRKNNNNEYTTRKGKFIMKVVIYKENGVYKTTTEENYNKNIRNAREICALTFFDNAEDIINYLVQYGKVKKEDFIVIE